MKTKNYFVQSVILASGFLLTSSMSALLASEEAPTSPTLQLSVDVYEKTFAVQPIDLLITYTNAGDYAVSLLNAFDVNSQADGLFIVVEDAGGNLVSSNEMSEGSLFRWSNVDPKSSVSKKLTLPDYFTPSVPGDYVLKVKYLHIRGFGNSFYKTNVVCVAPSIPINVLDNPVCSFMQSNQMFNSEVWMSKFNSLSDNKSKQWFMQRTSSNEQARAIIAEALMDQNVVFDDKVMISGALSGKEILYNKKFADYLRSVNKCSPEFPLALRVLPYMQSGGNDSAAAVMRDILHDVGGVTNWQTRLAYIATACSGGAILSSKDLRRFVELTADPFDKLSAIDCLYRSACWDDANTIINTIDNDSTPLLGDRFIYSISTNGFFVVGDMAKEYRKQISDRMQLK